MDTDAEVYFHVKSNMITGKFALIVSTFHKLVATTDGIRSTGAYLRIHEDLTREELEEHLADELASFPAEEENNDLEKKHD